MNHQTSTVSQVIPQVAYQSPQASTQLMTELPFVDLSFAVPVFSPRDDLIACLNKAMAFLTAVASSRFPYTNNQLRTSFNIRNQATIQDDMVTVQQIQGRQGKNYSGTTYKGNVRVQRKILQVDRQELLNATTAKNAAFQIEDLDTYDSDCDDLSTVQAPAGIQSRQSIAPRFYSPHAPL
nr:hypothetical protein [Tanacetum cinerariifolium]